MKRLILLLFCIIPTIGFNQDVKDSLYAIWMNKNLSDTSRFSAFNDLINEYIDSYSLDTAILFSKELLEASISADNQKYISYAYNSLGVSYYYSGDRLKAVENMEKSAFLKNKLGDVKGYTGTLQNLGAIYQSMGQVEKSLENSSKALNEYEKINDIDGIVDAKTNIALVYLDMNKPEKGKELLLSCLDFKDELGKDKVARLYANLGGVCNEMEDEKEALDYYTEAEKIYSELERPLELLILITNMAVNYSAIGENSISKEYYDKAFALVDNYSFEDNAFSLWHNYGGYWTHLGDYVKAIEAHEKALELAKKNSELAFMVSITNALWTLYKEKGMIGEALQIYELHVSLKDSLNSEENKERLLEQEIKYHYEKQKALDDAEHDKQLAIEQEAKEKQQILTYATAGGLGLVGIFLIFVFNRLKVTRKQKGVIEEQKAEVEEAHQEIKDSINYAKRIQSAILPPDKLVKEFLKDSFVIYKPKDIVAGDFYWMETVEDQVLFAAADCTGHGVPGAMVSVVCNNGLNRSVREHGLTEPGRILDKTREIVVQEFEKSEEEVKDGMDIALCSLKGNTLHYAGAHNPLWIIRKGTDEVEEIKADKQPIGKFDNPQPHTTHKVELNEGDTFYIFSDGYADQFGGDKGKKFKTANFKKLLLSIQSESIEKQKQLIDGAFEQWKGSLEQLDDVCVIGVRI